VPTSNAFTEQVFAELGRCLIAYQSIEQILKFLLPHISRDDAEAQAKASANVNWRELLDSKETLGGLMKLLSQRTNSNDPAAFNAMLKTLVAQRNEIIHHFVSQPFVRLETDEQFREAMQFLQSRRSVAALFLQPLQNLALEFTSQLVAANAAGSAPKSAA